MQSSAEAHWGSILKQAQAPNRASAGFLCQTPNKFGGIAKKAEKRYNNPCSSLSLETV